MTGARATSGGDGAGWADWCDRVGGLRGVAWGHSREADETSAFPGRARHYPRAADTNHRPGGQAATVAGYGGPGFHNWPAGHILRDNGSEAASSQPVPCSKFVR